MFPFEVANTPHMHKSTNTSIIYTHTDNFLFNNAIATDSLSKLLLHSKNNIWQNTHDCYSFVTLLKWWLQQYKINQPIKQQKKQTNKTKKTNDHKQITKKPMAWMHEQNNLMTIHLCCNDDDNKDNEGEKRTTTKVSLKLGLWQYRKGEDNDKCYTLWKTLISVIH